MKMCKGIIILSTIALFGLIGCGSTETTTTLPHTTTIKETSSPTAVAGVSVEVMDASSDNYKVLKLDGDKKLQVKLGSEKKDLYLLFTNKNTNHMQSATVTHNQKRAVTPIFSKNEIEGKEQAYQIQHAPSTILEFNRQSFNFKNNKIKDLNQKKVFKTTSDSEGDKKVFYMDPISNNTNVTATAKKVLSNIVTAMGTKKLTIWVEDDSWGNGCKHSTCITQEMVDTLAKKFLNDGLDNDIYDWVTNVFGEEWGASSSSSLIEPSNNISILLTDIGQDNKINGGVIGYFHSKDNFKQTSYSGSNERIMFYIDSVMYANKNKNGTWDENGFWAQQVFSTLAHEFQHMIYFYQKNIRQKLQGTDTWINEMLSESTEDLVAVKLHTDGPRDVKWSRGDAGEANNYNGRYPLFNKNNGLSMASWDNTLEDYSKVSSFGTYLLRNYGGAELLHDIVYSKFINEEALMDAIKRHSNGKSKTFDDLIHEWGVAVLLSKRDDISGDSGYLYNAGDYISSEHNGINYNLGSINFFNYTPNPTIATTMRKIAPKSNYYYKVGENLKGDIDLDIKDTAGFNVSVVVVK